MRLSIDVLGEQQYARRLDLFADELQDLSDPLTDAVEVVEGSVRDRFASEGGHSGHWQPLNPRYAKWKAARVGNAPMLVFTGRMRSAFLEDHDPNALREIGPRRAVYGVHGDVAVRAAAHQKGKGHVPARKILDLTALDRRQIDRVVVSWVTHKRRSIIGGGR